MSNYHIDINRVTVDVKQLMHKQSYQSIPCCKLLYLQ